MRFEASLSRRVLCTVAFGVLWLSSATSFADTIKTCQQDNAEACVDAGTAATDPKQAFELFRKACDFGDKNGCWLASDYAEKQVGRSEYTRLIAAGCKLGHSLCCEWHQKISDTEDQSARCMSKPTGESCLAAGQGVLPDQKAALKFFEKGCGVRDGANCLAVGNAFDELNKSDLALRFWKKSCDLKHDGGCEKIVEHERERDRRLCEDRRNVKSCFAAAEKLRTQGEDDSALPLYKKSCEFGHGSSCVSAGRIELAQGDLDTASSSFLSGCSYGNQTGCAMNQQVQAKIQMQSQEAAQAAALRDTQEANRRREETEAQAAEEQRRARGLEMMSKGLQQMNDSFRQPTQQRQTDYKCVNDCTGRGYLYDFCTNKCSY